MSNLACTIDSNGKARVDSDCSVNDIIQRFPDALPVLAAYGLDTCCRGNLSLHDAALDAGVEPSMVVDALEETLATHVPAITPLKTAQRSSCGCSS
jgi:iron-sulfur cluster repair protein YtfE (RIC family)